MLTSWTDRLAETQRQLPEDSLVLRARPFETWSTCLPTAYTCNGNVPSQVFFGHRDNKEVVTTIESLQKEGRLAQR